MIKLGLKIMLAATSAVAVGYAYAAQQDANGETGLKIQASALSPVRKTDERFQSFQLGFSHLTGGETWKSYDNMEKQGGAPKPGGNVADVREARAAADLSSPRLRNLTAALAPLYIRYSGTTANSVFFQDNDEPALATPPAGYTVVLTRRRWKDAVQFARSVNAKIVTSFANSAGVRDSSGSWTPLMAEKWLAYTKSIGGEIYAAELFNEPNAPEPKIAPKGHTAEEYARDFAMFRPFMQKAAPAIKLAGPGEATMGIPIPSIDHVGSEQYASANPVAKFDIFSYHFYPALAQRCAPPTSPQGISIDEALSEDWLARPDAQLLRHKALRDRYAPGKPLWLTETGGAACGGLTWQPTFLDAFRYVDTSARLAKQGLDVIVTHALISGSNGLIDEKTFLPNASYWPAVLWRKLVGAQVLDAGATRPGLHLYAHCLQGSAGGVTIMAINLGAGSRSIQVGSSANLYALTSRDMASKDVLLNGRPLALTAQDRLPAMAPKAIRSGVITLAPQSINFVAVPGARNKSCPA